MGEINLVLEEELVVNSYSGIQLCLGSSSVAILSLVQVFVEKEEDGKELLIHGLQSQC